MNKLGLLLVFFTSCVLTLQAQNEENNPIKYIVDYYSDFSTGYDFNGRYVTLTDNYKATITDSIFKLRFNSIDEHGKIQQQTITFNLNNVVSIEKGVNVVEVHHFDTIILPISFQLIFNLEDVSYVIDIHYSPEEDVEEIGIYKAFDAIISSGKKE